MSIIKPYDLYFLSFSCVKSLDESLGAVLGLNVPGILLAFDEFDGRIVACSLGVFVFGFLLCGVQCGKYILSIAICLGFRWCMGT